MSTHTEAPTRPRLTRTLSFRLVAVFIAVLTAIITILTITSVTFLNRFLMADLDDELVTTGRTIAERYLHRVAGPLPENGGLTESTADDPFELSEFYIHIHLTDQYWATIQPGNEGPGTLGQLGANPDAAIDGPEAQGLGTSNPDGTGASGTGDGTMPSYNFTLSASPVLVDRYGIPADVEQLERTLGQIPVTVDGTEDSAWRAVAVPIESGPSREVTGLIIIASPIGPKQAIVRSVAISLVMLGLLVGIIGAFIIYFLVTHSMAPLRRIERATHAIAEGDLSQRVPEAVAGSEVGMLSDSINVMLGQIEQSFDVKTQSEAKMRQFVSDASHELRTPLATVRGYAELYRLGGVPEDKLDQTMERVESEAVRMGGLVEDLLQLARLDEGRELELEPINVAEEARHAAEDFAVRTGNQNVRVIGLNGGEAADTVVVAEQAKVDQVLANLLTNVLTHTPEGTAVDIAVGTDGEYGVVEVRDHGPGVAEADREAIFERFFRTDQSRTRASGGSGLGLSIVASIMQSHGGTASAHETEGGGLTVRLEFPTAGPPVAEDDFFEDEADAGDALTVS